MDQMDKKQTKQQPREGVRCTNSLLQHSAVRMDMYQEPWKHKNCALIQTRLGQSVTQS